MMRSLYEIIHICTAMITLHFHLQPQYKYELFHINFTVVVVVVISIAAVDKIYPLNASVFR